MEIEWEDEPAEVEQPAGDSFSLGSVVISAAGPALSAGDLQRFEEQFGLQLPDDYRQIQRMHNGGKPEPGHLALKNSGVIVPIDVERFYSLLGADAPSGSLEAAALAKCFGSLLPFLPIARSRMPGPTGADVEPELVLILTGKKKGQIAILDLQMFGINPSDPAALASMPQLGEMLLGSCQKVAKDLGDLISRLKVRPTKRAPKWLQLIQQGDTVAFNAWLEAGGKLAETFSDYGDFRLMSVVEYLMRDAPVEMLRALLDGKAVKTKQLCASWERFEPWNITRFAELMQLLPRELWNRAFVSSAVWSDSTILAALAEAGVDVIARVFRKKGELFG